MTTYYKATFSNGRTLTRSTAGRSYTHAYATGGDAHYSVCSGWAKSAAHAHKAMASWRAYSALGGEVAPAIEITSAEYRALKKGTT